MQIFAVDSKQRLLEAPRAEKQRDYLCPECGGVVRLRGGAQRQLHFYHLKTIPSCRLNGKSETHLGVQYALQALFSTEECQLERRFPQIGRIADVVWEPKRLIFEIQCSPISAAEVKARNADYASVGYRVVWLLHDKRYNRSRATSAEYALRHTPHYYTNIDARGAGEVYDAWSRRDVPSVVDLRTPLIPKARGYKHPLQRRRARSWKFSFKGDLLHQTLSKEPFHFPKLSVKQLYLNLFDRLLAKCCINLENPPRDEDRRPP